MIVLRNISTGRVLQKKMLLEILENSWENTCWSLFSNKVDNLLKRDSETGSFPVNIAKFL